MSPHKTADSVHAPPTYIHSIKFISALALFLLFQPPVRPPNDHSDCTHSQLSGALQFLTSITVQIFDLELTPKKSVMLI